MAANCNAAVQVACNPNGTTRKRRTPGTPHAAAAASYAAEQVAAPTAVVMVRCILCDMHNEVSLDYRGA